MKGITASIFTHTHHNQRNPTTMSKLTLTGLALPLFLLFASPQASGPKAFGGTRKVVQSQEHSGTLQKMIVENGSVTMDLDLNRLNGIGSAAAINRQTAIRCRGQFLLQHFGL